MEISRRCVPFTPCDKPLADLTVAIVSTAGAHLQDQEPFATAGDLTFRVIAGDTDTDRFTVTHGAPKEEYDTAAPKQDINCIFPLDRLRELAQAGRIAGVAEKHLSLMGYTMRLKQFLDETVPQVAKAVERSRADAVVLTAG